MRLGHMIGSCRIVQAREEGGLDQASSAENGEEPDLEYVLVVGSSMRTC